MKNPIPVILTVWLCVCSSGTGGGKQVRLVPIADGWAENSVNAVIFRHNSIVTYHDVQYVAFYDPQKIVVLAKRKLGATTWTVQKTRYKGNAEDAHNAISIMTDGDGYLHMAWNHHGSPLNYCRSVHPGSLELTVRLPMTGLKEQTVTYPEFYRLPDGDLLFLYRDGISGKGDLVVNHYDAVGKKWTQRQNGLISGEDQRNAYWQAAVDAQGTIHLSWVWRESWDVSTNHDLGYAESTDEGITWSKSTGEKYRLPITAGNAEYACRIPQQSELINQTSMTTDSKGNPYIATYWRPAGTAVPQFHLVYHDGGRWRSVQVSRRTTPFSLSGGGTKRIPVSRPQLVVFSDDGMQKACMLFRDIERGSMVSAAICDDLEENNTWRFLDLTDFNVGMWEPSIDTELWVRSGMLHVFVQNVGQGDAEGLQDLQPQPVSILEWRPE
jgi:hypothetical protein